jgi:hypothetical protein
LTGKREGAKGFFGCTLQDVGGAEMTISDFIRTVFASVNHVGCVEPTK